MPRLNHEQHYIGGGEGRSDGAVQRLVERIAVTRLEAGRINVHILRIIMSLYASDAMARGLRLARSDTDLGTDQLVHEGGLAHIGPPDNRNVAAPKTSGGGRSAHADLL